MRVFVPRQRAPHDIARGGAQPGFIPPRSPRAATHIVGHAEMATNFLFVVVTLRWDDGKGACTMESNRESVTQVVEWAKPAEAFAGT